MPATPFGVPVEPDWEGLLACVRRSPAPRRVHFIELFLDAEVQRAICERYDLLDGLDPHDPHFLKRAYIRVQRFLGYDYVTCSPRGVELTFSRLQADDTADLRRTGGRQYMEEHHGPISSWADFEAYPWPDADAANTEDFEWYSENLPDDMCIIAFGAFGHPCEHLTWLMGYESLCFALYDQPDLVEAIARRCDALSEAMAALCLQFPRVKIMWGSDDMGFRSGTLISPADMRHYVLPEHKRLAAMSHAAGRPYILHSCGNLAAIMPDLIDDVGIDGKHSFEDTIEEVTVSKQKYGDRIALLGGIDLDFLCRAGEEAVRQRVRATLDACLPGGGYVLGTGNSVANYIPLDNYLAMLDEGRRYSV